MNILSDRFLNKKYPHTYESSECMCCARAIAQDQLDADLDWHDKQVAELFDALKADVESWVVNHYATEVFKTSNHRIKRSAIKDMVRQLLHAHKKACQESAEKRKGDRE